MNLMWYPNHLHSNSVFPVHRIKYGRLNCRMIRNSCYETDRGLYNILMESPPSVDNVNF